MERDTHTHSGKDVRLMERTTTLRGIDQRERSVVGAVQNKTRTAAVAYRILARNGDHIIHP